MHEEHEERGHEDPHRVQRVDDVGRLRRGLRGRRARRGLEQVDGERDQRAHRDEPEHLPGEQQPEALLRLALSERADREPTGSVGQGFAPEPERLEPTDVRHELCHGAESTERLFRNRVRELKARLQAAARRRHVL
jgi:hypothetical protein